MKPDRRTPGEFNKGQLLASSQFISFRKLILTPTLLIQLKCIGKENEGFRINQKFQAWNHKHAIVSPIDYFPMRHNIYTWRYSESIPKSKIFFNFIFFSAFFESNPKLGITWRNGCQWVLLDNRYFTKSGTWAWYCEIYTSQALQANYLLWCLCNRARNNFTEIWPTKVTYPRKFRIAPSLPYVLKDRLMEVWSSIYAECTNCSCMLTSIIDCRPINFRTWTQILYVCSM